MKKKRFRAREIEPIDWEAAEGSTPPPPPDKKTHTTEWVRWLNMWYWPGAPKKPNKKEIG